MPITFDFIKNVQTIYPYFIKYLIWIAHESEIYKVGFKKSIYHSQMCCGF